MFDFKSLPDFNKHLQFKQQMVSTFKHIDLDFEIKRKQDQNRNKDRGEADDFRKRQRVKCILQISQIFDDLNVDDHDVWEKIKQSVDELDYTYGADILDSQYQVFKKVGVVDEQFYQKYKEKVSKLFDTRIRHKDIFKMDHFGLRMMKDTGQQDQYTRIAEHFHNLINTLNTKQLRFYLQSQTQIQQLSDSSDSEMHQIKVKILQNMIRKVIKSLQSTDLELTKYQFMYIIINLVVLGRQRKQQSAEISSECDLCLVQCLQFAIDENIYLDIQKHQLFVIAFYLGQKKEELEGCEEDGKDRLGRMIDQTIEQIKSGLEDESTILYQIRLIQFMYSEDSHDYVMLDHKVSDQFQIQMINDSQKLSPFYFNSLLNIIRKNLVNGKQENIQKWLEYFTICISKLEIIFDKAINDIKYGKADLRLLQKTLNCKVFKQLYSKEEQEWVKRVEEMTKME